MQKRIIECVPNFSALTREGCDRIVCAKLCGDEIGVGKSAVLTVVRSVVLACRIGKHAPTAANAVADEFKIQVVVTRCLF